MQLPESTAIEISTDPARLQAEAIHAALARTYWAADRPLALVRRSLEHSLSFGLFERGGVRERQIGLARVVTDRATFAYLCDVYVLEEFRGRGLGRRLLEHVLAHPDLQGLRRFSLITRDAHGLYAELGFRPLAAPEQHMERVEGPSTPAERGR